MNFDVRSYCEQLESANRGYRVVESLSDESYWTFGTASKEHGRALVYAFFCSTDLEGKLWAFIGPLADELLDKQQHTDYEDDGPGYTVQRSFCFMASRSDMSLLEAMFAAVVERLEQPHAKV